MNKTKIEWVKNPDGSQGWSWSPITGCLNGCDYCYARKLANGRLKERYLANPHFAPISRNIDEMRVRVGADPRPTDPFYPRFWPERMAELQPIGGLVCEPICPPRRGRGIFVCDMSDLFGRGILADWTTAVLDVIRRCPQHRFYLLTKQPQNLARWSPFPNNVWVGQTLTGLEPDLLDRLRQFADIAAQVKFISFEPLKRMPMMGGTLISKGGKGFQWDELVQWIIIGAQTKPLVLPEKAWVDELVGAADRADIPVFLKNSLAPLYPGGLRQEVPK